MAAIDLNTGPDLPPKTDYGIGCVGAIIGRALYDVLLARLDADGVHTVLAVIASPNPASEALHRACGFTQVGVLPEVGFKHDRWIDTAFWARVR